MPDLHVWVLGSRQPILTVHALLADGMAVEPARKAMSSLLAERFDIQHATLQVEDPASRDHLGDSEGHA